MMQNKIKFTMLLILMGYTATKAQTQNQMKKQININAPVKCTKSIIINASTEKVWNVMTNINQWAKWQSNISEPKIVGTLRPNTTFVWKTGGAKIHSKLHTVEPFTHFGWTGKTFGMFAIHNWSLTDVLGNTEVYVSESMEGFLASLFKKTFNKNLDRDMKKWLELMKIECEK